MLTQFLRRPFKPRLVSFFLFSEQVFTASTRARTGTEVLRINRLGVVPFYALLVSALLCNARFRVSRFSSTLGTQIKLQHALVCMAIFWPALSGSANATTVYAQFDPASSTQVIFDRTG